MNNQPQSENRASTFQPVEGGGETRSGELLLVEAYVVLWLILFGWLFLLRKKTTVIESRLAEIDGALQKAEARTASEKK